MAEVLSGFAVIWVIIGVGFLAGQTGVLGPEGRSVLSRTAFFIGSPALLFTTLSQADVTAVLGPQLWVAASSAFVCAAVFMLVTRFVLPSRAASERVIAALGSSMVNSANLGLPIAAYVLGDAALAAPVILFQLAIYTPLYITVVEAALAAESRRASLPDDGRPPSGRRSPSAYGRFRRVVSQLGQTARNPMIIGSVLGLVFSATGWSLPAPLWDSVELIGGLSIPAMLIAFGMSLADSRPLRRADGRIGDAVLASAMKLVAHPVIAWLIGAFVVGLDGRELMIAVVLASLPTAQNVFVAAVRYETGQVVAKDTVLVTTVLAIPAMMVVALVFA